MPDLVHRLNNVTYYKCLWWALKQSLWPIYCYRKVTNHRYALSKVCHQFSDVWWNCSNDDNRCIESGKLKYSSAIMKSNFFKPLTYTSNLIFTATWAHGGLAPLTPDRIGPRFYVTRMGTTCCLRANTAVSPQIHCNPSIEILKYFLKEFMTGYNSNKMSVVTVVRDKCVNQKELG